MVSKASIKNALDLAYKYGSLEFLGVCDGGKQGQVGEIDGQVVWDSKDEESWREVFYNKASAVEFAREIGAASLGNDRLA